MRVGESLGNTGGDNIIKGAPKGKEGQKEFKPKEKAKEKEFNPKELTKEEVKVDLKEREGVPRELGKDSQNNGIKKDRIAGEGRLNKEEEKEGKKEIKEVTGNVSRGDEQSFKNMDVGETATIKGAQAVDTSEAKARIDAVNRIITNNVSDLQVNGQGAFLTLKTDSVEIPEVFRGAQVELNLTDQGLTVQFTLAHGASEASAIDLMQKGDLASLQMSLADKGIHLHEMKMGNTNIVLPEVARAEQMAPRSIFEAEGGRRDREGGGGGGEGGGEKEREPQK